jgi:hypothetical protein
MKQDNLFKNFSILVCTLLLITLTGCDFLFHMHLIDFVIPNNYHGPIYIIHDETNGVIIVKKHGRYTLTIPTNGKLRVHDFNFMGDWHRETAHFENGQQMPTDTDPGVSGVLATNMIALRDGSSWEINDGKGKVSKFLLYFIGTKQDLENMDRNKITAP